MSDLKRPTKAELAIIADNLKTVKDGGKLPPEALARLRFLGYIVGNPPELTVTAKSIIETYRLNQRITP